MKNDLFVLWKDNYSVYRLDDPNTTVGYVDAITLLEDETKPIRTQADFSEYIQKIKALLPKQSYCYNALCLLLDSLIDQFYDREELYGCFYNDGTIDNPVYVEIE